MAREPHASTTVGLDHVTVFGTHVFTVKLAGQRLNVSAPGAVFCTVTVNEHVFVRNCESTAVHVTGVTPVLNVEPLTGRHLTDLRVAPQFPVAVGV
jgi:hypothetical protein